MTNSLSKIYKKHHSKNRPSNFSLLEEDRGKLLNHNIGRGKKVLDIGCRDGVLTKHFSSGNDVLGVDIDNDALVKASKDLGMRTKFVDLNGDWDELSSEYFDVIVAGEILEHLYFPEKIISQVINRLKKDKNSIFIGSVPNAFSLKNRLRYLMASKKFTPLSDPTHINHFSYNELLGLLKKYFDNVEILGLGRYERLSKMWPQLFAFDLFFICKCPKNIKNET